MRFAPMQFKISKNEEVWNVTPLSGALAGQVVATVDGINLQDVVFAGKTAIGSIRAVWGLNILMEEVYADPGTLQGLRIGGVFSTNYNERITLDYDGYMNAANHICKAARKLLIIGSRIYGKGAI